MDPTSTIQEGLTQSTTTNTPDGQTGAVNLGKQNEQLLSEIHGPYFAAGIRRNLFTFNVTAVTVPVVASALVSVFSLYNPTSGGKVLELVDFDMGNLSTTTVIDVVGLYWSGAPLGDKGTFSTPSVFGTNHFGASPGLGSPVGIPYTAYTHSGTPARIAILNSANTTTDVTGVPLHYDFNGKIVLYPGDVVSVAASTAAMHASTTDLAIRWAEWPVPA
jgi:hypothetical protein